MKGMVRELFHFSGLRTLTSLLPLVTSLLGLGLCGTAEAWEAGKPSPFVSDKRSQVFCHITTLKSPNV